MAIGRTFKEALQKGLRSLEIGRYGFGADGKDIQNASRAVIEQRLATPNSQRIFYLKAALETGLSIDFIYELTGIDPWFLYQLNQIITLEKTVKQAANPMSDDLLIQAKTWATLRVLLPPPMIKPS